MMNRIGWMVALILVSGSSLAHADGFGVTGGLNLGNVTISPFVTTSSKVGFEVGGHYSYSLDSNFSIEPGLSLVQRGYSESLSANNTYSASITYLEAPVFLKATVPFGDVNAFLGVGPNLGLRMGVGCTITTGSCTMTSDTTKSTDFSVDFAAGAGLPMTSGELTFQIRYHLGMANIYNVTSSVTDIKNTGLAFLLGWNFI